MKFIRHLLMFCRSYLYLLGLYGLHLLLRRFLSYRRMLASLIFYRSFVSLHRDRSMMGSNDAQVVLHTCKVQEMTTSYGAWFVNLERDQIARLIQSSTGSRSATVLETQIRSPLSTSQRSVKSRNLDSRQQIERFAFLKLVHVTNQD